MPEVGGLKCLKTVKRSALKNPDRARQMLHTNHAERTSDRFFFSFGKEDNPQPLHPQCGENSGQLKGLIVQAGIDPPPTVQGIISTLLPTMGSPQQFSIHFMDFAYTFSPKTHSACGQCPAIGRNGKNVEEQET